MCVRFIAYIQRGPGAAGAMEAPALFALSTFFTSPTFHKQLLFQKHNCIRSYILIPGHMLLLI